MTLEEYSQRALDLTKHIISMNPAHYTVWNYRQKLLLELNADLYAELDFLDDFTMDNPKNYQLWHHRQVIVERINDCSRELGFLKEIFALDAKNYHAWTYRQWLVKKFDLWDGELAFTNELIVEDVRNNSAWNQRYFVWAYGPTKFNDKSFQQEVEYVQSHSNEPNNESPWNYLTGIYRLYGTRTGIRELKDYCESYVQRTPTSPHAYSLLLDIYEELGDRNKALECAKILAANVDSTRKAYWQHRIELIS